MTFMNSSKSAPRLRSTGGASFVPLLAALSLTLLGPSPGAANPPGDPVSVYITWAAHDELSDTVVLDEDLAMRELAAVARLKAA